MAPAWERIGRRLDGWGRGNMGLEPASGTIGLVDESRIALAGPAVNLALALLLLPFVLRLSGPATTGPAAVVRALRHLSPAGFLISI